MQFIIGHIRVSVDHDSARFYNKPAHGELLYSNNNQALQMSVVKPGSIYWNHMFGDWSDDHAPSEKEIESRIWKKCDCYTWGCLIAEYSCKNLSHYLNNLG